MSVLDRYTDILIDPPALALLHTEKYKEFIPIIIARFNTYTTKLAIMELLSLLNYYKIQYDKKLIKQLYKIYKIIELDDEIIHRSSLILSDLLHHDIQVDTLDIIHAAISLEKKLIIITADNSRYEIFRKYGIITVHVDELINTIKRLFQKT